MAAGRDDSGPRHRDRVAHVRGTKPKGEPMSATASITEDERPANGVVVLGRARLDRSSQEHSSPAAI